MHTQSTARCGRFARAASHVAVAALLLALAIPAHARPWGRHGGEGGRMHPAMTRGAWMNRGSRRQDHPGPIMRPREHPGQEHLPQWYRQHKDMTFQQQEHALRHQPGFNRLSPAQRRRVLNRLRYLDSQPPAVRRRMMARNEAFERLSPERRQEVRAAAQAFQRMPLYRKQQLGRAFNVLRTLPPDQRTAILNSARFQAQYTPRERHILGNLLSIEPWQPAQQPLPPPPPQRR